MNKTNIKIGNTTERKVLEILKKHGYWAYLTALKANGQPVDIIAMKGRKNLLIDAKHVREEDISFSFDRIEPNQETTMLYATNFASLENIGFAIEFERLDEVLWLSYKDFLELKLCAKSVNAHKLISLEKYLEDLDNESFDV